MSEEQPISAVCDRGADARGHIPALRWLRRYDRSWLGSNVLAGLTTAAVVSPQAMVEDYVEAESASG